VVGHLGCFHNLAIVNSAAINMGVQVPLELTLTFLTFNFQVVSIKFTNRKRFQRIPRRMGESGNLWPYKAIFIAVIIKTVTDYSMTLFVGLA
jgi:hypothetical protein